MITIAKKDISRLADKIAEVNKDYEGIQEWSDVILDFLQDNYKLENIITEELFHKTGEVR